MTRLAALELELQGAQYQLHRRRAELRHIHSWRVQRRYPPSEHVLAMKRASVAEAQRIVDAHLTAITRAEVG